MTPTLKSIFVLLTAISAFNLGRYSAEFSGSAWAWTSAVLGVVVLAVTTASLVFGFW